MKYFQCFVCCLAVVVFTTMLAGALSAKTLEKATPFVNTPVKPRASAAVKAKKLPDLQVGAMKISPQSPGEGQNVIFEGNIMNYGEGSAQNPVVTLKVTGPSGVSIPLFRKQFNVTLGKNQGVTLVQKFKVPKFGNYICTFTLDPSRMIAETDDVNNIKHLSFEAYALPDLVVCISNGKRPPVSGRREIKAVVKNIGNGNCADYLKLQFYVEGKGTKVYDLLPINAGDSREVTRSHEWSTSGTKTITARVIYSKKESNKSNNKAQGSFFVRLPHHDKYSAAPKVKCSNNRDFTSWEQCDSMN